MEVKNLTTIEENGTLSFFLEKRIYAANAPDVEKELVDFISNHGNKVPVFDASEMEYISSAGLRVLLGAAQVMEGKGEMVVRNVI